MAYKLDHIGIVVRNIEEAAKLYGDLLGLTPWSKGISAFPHVGIKQVQLRKGDDFGNNFIELLEPIKNEEGVETIFSTHLKERGEGLFHISVFIDDYDKRISELRKKGFTVEEWRDENLFPGHTLRMGWLQPKDTHGVWIEFVDATAIPEFYKTL